MLKTSASKTGDLAVGKQACQHPRIVILQIEIMRLVGRPWSPCFDCRWGQEIIPLSQLSRLVLGPSQPPIHWVPGAVSPGPKQRMREADHSRTSVVEVKNERRDTTTSPCVHLLHRDSFHFIVTKCVFLLLLLLLTWLMF